MGKYINKNDKYAISELLKTFINVASGKNIKKSFSIKKANDNTAFFNNMGIGDLAKPISKRNTSVKKQSFTTPYNSSSSMSNYGMQSTNINQTGSRNSSFGNTSNQFGSNNTFNQNYNKPIKSSPYGGTQQGSYGQQQPKQYRSTPYGGNAVPQSNYNRYAQSQNIQQPQQIQKPLSNMQPQATITTPQNFSDYMNLKPQKISFGTQVSPTIVQNNGSNTGRANTPGVNPTPIDVSRTAQFGNINETAATDYYSYIKNPEFKAGKFNTTKIVFLDNTGKVIPPEKLNDKQKKILNDPNSKKNGSAIQYFNYENKKLAPAQLPQTYKTAIAQEEQRQLAAQKTIYNADIASRDRAKQAKILALQNQIKNSINTGQLNPELALQLSRQGEEFSGFQTNSNARR